MSMSSQKMIQAQATRRAAAEPCQGQNLPYATWPEAYVFVCLFV